MSKLLKTKYSQTHWFDSEKLEFNDINIDELLDIQHNQLSSRFERWTYEGSGWKTNSVIQHQLVTSEIATCEGSSYLQLPKELRNPMKGLINIQNEDNKCFRWCLVRYLNLVNKKPAKNRNVDKEFAKKPNFKSRKTSCS